MMNQQHTYLEFSKRTENYAEKVETNIKEDRKLLEEIGFEVTILDLKEYFDNNEKIKEKILTLSECDLNVNFSEDTNIKDIKELENVEEISYEGNILLVIYKKGKNNLGELIDYLKDNKVTYSKIFSERPTLNDVFLELTGKELRD